jgi:ABC-2 type transport system ATP-binding protein
MAAYSSGQKKKIALAAALITEAPVMLLDEPFSGGLDPSGILALKRVLQRLRDARKTTVVMATPVPELVEDLAERIAVLRRGEVLAYDTIAGLAKMTGSSGMLDEIYDKLLDTRKASHVEAYFQGRNI